MTRRTRTAWCRVQGECDDLPLAHRLGGLEHALAVDPDMALLDESLSERATFDQPDAVEVTVDPHA